LLRQTRKSAVTCHLDSKSICITAGTIVDATINHAPRQHNLADRLFNERQHDGASAKMTDFDAVRNISAKSYLRQAGENRHWMCNGAIEQVVPLR
jgi:hypothetical protein